MSRIGKLPVKVPAGVTVTIADGNVVTVKGPKGELTRAFAREMIIEQKDNEVTVSRPSEEELRQNGHARRLAWTIKQNRAMHGLTRTLINNMVIGVSEGFQKVLEVNGVGYRAAKAGKVLTLNLGYSHPVEMTDPDGIETVCEGQNKIIVKGISKEKVGQYAAEIRTKRPPEPYKGKGIKYDYETIRRKVGKTGKK